jgi:hypothetical protein
MLDIFLVQKILLKLRMMLPLLPSLMASRLFLCPELCWPWFSEADSCGPTPWPDVADAPWAVVDPWDFRELVDPESSDRSVMLKFCTPWDSWEICGGALWVFLCCVRGDNCWALVSCEVTLDWTLVRVVVCVLLFITLLAVCWGT